MSKKEFWNVSTKMHSRSNHLLTYFWLMFFEQFFLLSLAKFETFGRIFTHKARQQWGKLIVKFFTMSIWSLNLPARSLSLSLSLSYTCISLPTSSLFSLIGIFCLSFLQSKSLDRFLHFPDLARPPKPARGTPANHFKAAHAFLHTVKPDNTHLLHKCKYPLQLTSCFACLQ